MQNLFGLFLGENLAWSIPGGVLIALILGYTGAKHFLWSFFAVTLLFGFGAPPVVFAIYVPLALIFNIPVIRRTLVTRHVMKVMKSFLPKVSETERIALEAGVVWIEADLFSGKPDFKKLRQVPYPELTAEEKAFLDGPVDRLCDLSNDWKIWQDRDLPPEAWELMKKERMWGMIIPKEYGGLEFSALAHSEVIMKLASRSTVPCVTVMVPNSLGPAELLIHYGTEEQKKHLLPRLARGEEIPCFALTEPTAGSDAASIQSSGILFKGSDGKLYIRLNWNKRWITLAAISTILGLAFRLKDPENFLGKGPDVGITCALIPTNTKGVVVGKRHDPMGVPFYNCPTQGHDVVVPVDCIVGGIGGAGCGWKMLMECLSAGRGISLPAQSVGGAKGISRVVSAHASVRKQFGLPIGKFEGIEEPIARIAGFTYLMEAMRKVTCGGLDLGIKPPVITAISKYHQTELLRKITLDGMDVFGGAGISRGPRNVIANAYIAVPVGITVEGANIMTRTLIIFGQGALRAHPYAYQEVKAVESGDLPGFDSAFWGHFGHVVRNLFRSVLLSVTRGVLSPSPVSGPTAVYYRKLGWVSASFAIMADIAMGSLGGTLKLREKITGRYADILGWMYIGFCILRRFEAEGSRQEDLPFVHYGMKYAFWKIQEAFDGIFENITVPALSWFFRGPLRWWSHLNTLGDDAEDDITHEIAVAIQTDGEQRDRLTAGIYIPKAEGEAIRRLENAFKVAKSCEAAEAKIYRALRKKELAKGKPPHLYEEAFKKGIITEVELANLKRGEELRSDAITVDDFSQEEYVGRRETQNASRA